MYRSLIQPAPPSTASAARTSDRPALRETLLSIQTSKTAFLRMDVGDLRLIGRMSMFGPMVVAGLRDFRDRDGDIGYAYLSSDTVIRSIDKLDPRLVHATANRRPWSNVALEYCLCRHWGAKVQVPLPSITRDHAMLIARVFGTPTNDSSKPVSPAGIWLTYARRWITKYGDEAAEMKVETYFPGWLQAAVASAPAPSTTERLVGR